MLVCSESIGNEKLICFIIQTYKIVIMDILYDARAVQNIHKKSENFKSVQNSHCSYFVRHILYGWLFIVDILYKRHVQNIPLKLKGWILKWKF